MWQQLHHHHYVFDLWDEAWRSKIASEELIFARHADDLVAERFLKDFEERLAKFGVENRFAPPGYWLTQRANYRQKFAVNPRTRWRCAGNGRIAEPFGNHVIVEI